MIREIKISGFKSLVNFGMKLKSGLNILVGPNGSGKTNIITFFEFLGDLQEMSVSNAISTAGGAGAVLTKIGENEYCTNLSATVTGKVQLTKRRYVFYEYSFNIEMFPTADRITYKQQRLKVKFRSVDKLPNKKVLKYDLDIERLTDPEMKMTAYVHSVNPRIIRDRFLGHIRKQENGLSKDEKKLKRHKENLEKIILDAADHDHSMVPSLRFFLDDGFVIMRDLRGGPVFNIEPSKARIPEDSAKPPGIRKDGSGLYATLYAMKQNEDVKRHRRHPYYFYRDEYLEIGNAKLSDVFEYVRLANESIKSIEVINNPFDNQLQVRIAVSGATNDAVLPLASMSDGTIKWIALVTILFTSRTVFSIEEPENYLHPHMQSEILSVMRSKTNMERSILMSTHSETLLNSAKPDEIIVVSFINGKTHAHRPSNVKDIKIEINRTGFGLGYYYLAGSLDE